MLVAIDTETHLIQEDNKCPSIVCMSVAHDGLMLEIYGKSDIYYAAERLFNMPYTFIFQNAPYDLAVISKACPSLESLIWSLYEDNRIRDVGIREKLIDIRNGVLSSERGAYSLGTMAKKYCNKVLDKSENGWRLRYSELENISIKEWPSSAMAYALEDAQYTLEVYKAQERILQDSPLPPGEEGRQVRAHWALHLTSLRGLRTDPAAVEMLERETRSKIELSRQVLFANSIYHRDKKGQIKLSKKGEPMRNMKSVKGIIEKAYTQMGIPIPKTEKGNICTDEATLSESGNETLLTLAGISGDTKILTAYIPLLKTCTHKRVQTNFNPLLETGRTSSFKPNVQQWPRNGSVRECLIPEDGYVFVSCDYDTLELCALAQVLLWRFGTSSMAAAINNGRDLHLVVAAHLSNVDYEDAVSRFSEDNSELIHKRQLAKVANFGFAGGMGAETFVKYAAGAGVRITLDESYRLKNAWLSAWPEMQQYFQVAAEHCGDFGDKQLNCWVSGRQVSGLTFTSYCNYQFQALAADGAKHALFETVKLCMQSSGSALVESIPYNFIHDQIILETPKEKAPEAGEELSRVMNSVMQHWIPDVKISSSPVLMSKWCKKAKTLRDKNGRLQVWK